MRTFFSNTLGGEVTLHAAVELLLPTEWRAVISRQINLYVLLPCLSQMKSGV